MTLLIIGANVTLRKANLVFYKTTMILQNVRLKINYLKTGIVT